VRQPRPRVLLQGQGKRSRFRGAFLPTFE
jgi:hypothetical protein